MAISFRSLASTSVNWDTKRTSFVVAKPTGAVVGDLVYAVVLLFADAASAPSFTTPSGWTASQVTYSSSDPWANRLVVMTKPYDGEASWTFTHGLGWSGGVVAAFSGVDLTTPLDTTTFTSSKNGGAGIGQPTLSGMTTATDGALLVAARQSWDGLTSTAPANWTERWDEGDAVWTREIAVAGSVGSTTFPSGNNHVNNPWGLIVVALRPAGDEPEANTGTLTATLPKVTASVTGSATNSGTLSASAPKVTGSISGTARNVGTLAATVAAVAATIAGASVNPASMDADLPTVAAAITGTATNSGTLDAELPTVETTLTGTQTNSGDVGATLPVVTASIGGQSKVAGTLDATLPAAEASIEGTSTNAGTLSASLPVVLMSIGDESRIDGALSTDLPTLTVAIAGTQRNPGTFTVSLPTVTATLAGASANPASIDASIPVVTGSINGLSFNPGVLSAHMPMATMSVGDAIPRDLRILAIEDRGRVTTVTDRSRTTTVEPRLRRTTITYRSA